MSEESVETAPEIQSEEGESQAQEQVQAVEKQKSGYVDFEKSLDEQKATIRDRFSQHSRVSKELKGKYETERERVRKLEQELLELKKPAEVQRPDADLWITDPDEARRQEDAYTQSQVKARDYEYEKQRYEEAQRQEAERERAERIGRVIRRAETANIPADTLTYAAQTLQGRITPELERYLMDQEHAPQLIVKLAENPLELQQLTALSPMEAGVKIRSLSDSFRQKTISNAPPPDDSLKGTSVPDGKNPWLEGVKYL